MREKLGEREKSVPGKPAVHELDSKKDYRPKIDLDKHKKER